MPRLRIDDRQVEVPDGSSILDAARIAGIDIPTLCHVEGIEAQSSCLVCLVRLRGSGRLVPSCATRATESMEVESETPEVRKSRKVALELLLSDHAGDCSAPCQMICPAHMDVPTMIREIAEGRFHDALVTVKRHIALPAVLGRICPKPCEKGCRRSDHDGAVSVCLLKQSAADVDLAGGDPYVPARRSPRGKRVAILGTGPTGLAAAYYLLEDGFDVTLFDDHPEPGGALRYSVGEDALPRSVLDGEIEVIRRLGAEFRLGVRVGVDLDFEALVRSHDAVLIAVGTVEAPGFSAFGLAVSPQGLAVDRESFATARPGVFAAGGVVRKGRLAVKSVADGRSAAISIAQSLLGQASTGRVSSFHNRLIRVQPIEVTRMAAEASSLSRVAPAAGAVLGFSAEEARHEASRCLHCDCARGNDCRLRTYAARYGAEAGRFRGERREVEIHRRTGDVVYEPGKCIACGLCVRITERGGEELGLAFIGRGFHVRIGVPFNRGIDEALRKVAAECIAACPTGALAHARRRIERAG